MPDSTIKLDDLLKMLAEIFEFPPEQLTLGTPQEEIPGWDSMGILSVMAEFDERFNLLLSSEQLQSFRRIDDIVEVLRTNNKLA
jgi:acyl carrier protein